MASWETYRTSQVPHPFSLSIAHDDLVIVSGIGGHYEDGSIGDSVEEQSRRAFEAVEEILKANGASLDDVIFIRPWVTSRDHARGFDAVVEEVLPEPRPAAGALAIVDLADPRMLVEIEVHAVRGATRKPLERN